jgi:hypothetical protein
MTTQDSTRWRLVERVGPRGTAVAMHVVEELAVGRPAGVPVSIGGVALTFRPRRTGARRGETVCYRDFTAADRRKAALVAAAPRLAEALELLAAAVDAADSPGKAAVLEMRLAEARLALADAEPAPPPA